MAQQIPLKLVLTPRFERADFEISPANETAFALLDAWPAWPDQVMLLLGPKGSGKSHLASIWAQKAQALAIEVPHLLERSPEELARYRALVLEDLDQISQHQQEVQLFHLLNLFRETKGFILITGCKSVSEWGLQTADLLSRLRLAPTSILTTPDDHLLRALLVKQFADRQLIVDPHLVEFIAARMPRSFDAVRSLVTALDLEALSQGKKISRAMVSKWLNEVEVDEVS